MWKVLSRARNRFARDQHGNVAIIFAVSAVPLIGLLGGAVDMTRHQRHKVELLNAMDSAAIALARRGAENDEDADAFVNAYIAAIRPSTDPMLSVRAFNATQIAGGWRVESDAAMETAFMPLIGIPEMQFDLATEVMTGGGKYEVALALDNTGSMAERNKIGDLREASNHLVDILYDEPGAEDRVKMALVPFTTTVNIRGEAFDPDWLDPEGLGLGTHRFDAYDRTVNRLDIFEELSAGRVGPDGLPVAWKGCVEAREGGLDVDDTEPGADAVTRWTPYLSPDGSDERGNPRWASENSYLLDRTGGRGSPLERLRNTDKYFTPTFGARFDPFDTDNGPNQSCRGPIVELTNSQERMRDAIDAMEPGGFTHIPQGLVWGWRVLSPEEPFSQGVAYDDAGTQKALVLLSDGVNTFPEIYTSYGLRAGGRLATTERAGVRRLNEKTVDLCEKVKARGIRLYMILFQENDRETQRIFEDCASVNDNGESLYYYAPDGESLRQAFGSIGEDLTSIRITR
ncbi:MAG: pilus assembly protein TadG-related protein [Propylenella sp.]